MVRARVQVQGEGEGDHHRGEHAEHGRSITDKRRIPMRDLIGLRARVRVMVRGMVRVSIEFRVSVGVGVRVWGSVRNSVLDP